MVVIVCGCNAKQPEPFILAPLECVMAHAWKLISFILLTLSKKIMKTIKVSNIIVCTRNVLLLRLVLCVMSKTDTLYGIDKNTNKV